MKRSAATGVVAAGVALIAGSCVGPVARPVEAAGRATVTQLPPPRPIVPPLRSTDSASSVGTASVGIAQQGGLFTGILPGGASNLTLDGQPVRVAADGRFIVGFGRDAPPVSVLRMTLADGSADTMRINVAPRIWPTETIASVPRFAQPSAEFARRRPAELAQINAARRVNADGDGWRQQFMWPVTGRISGQFGSQRIYANGERGDPHSGVDIARPAGTPVVAPADGVVVLAASAPFTLEGNLLMVDHGMGLNSAFLHLSRIDVRVGDRVRQGQPVGAVGATGRASGPHLHWAMKWLDRRIDPQPLAGAMR